MQLWSGKTSVSVSARFIHFLSKYILAVSYISDTQLRAGRFTASSNLVQHFSLGGCISPVTSLWSYSSCHNSLLCNRLSVHVRVLLPGDDSSRLIPSVFCLILSHLWEESVLSYWNCNLMRLLDILRASDYFQQTEALVGEEKLM